MFTSNQELKISGEFHNISTALNFALKLSEQDKHLTKSERERGCKILFQLTDDKYCIGWGFKDVPNGWTEYQFDFDVEIVSKIIEQYLKKLVPVNAEDEDVMSGDGGTRDGFIMKCPWMEGEYDNENDIRNRNYCIVYFQKFVNYYAK